MPRNPEVKCTGLHIDACKHYAKDGKCIWCIGKGRCFAKSYKKCKKPWFKGIDEETYTIREHQGTQLKIDSPEKNKSYLKSDVPHEKNVNDISADNISTLLHDNVQLPDEEKVISHKRTHNSHYVTKSPSLVQNSKQHSSLNMKMLLYRTAQSVFPSSFSKVFYHRKPLQSFRAILFNEQGSEKITEHINVLTQFYRKDHNFSNDEDLSWIIPYHIKSTFIVNLAKYYDINIVS